MWFPSTELIQLTYTITYDGNINTSGTAPTDSYFPYPEDSTVTVLGNTGSLAKTGYTFSGWNTEPNGTGISYSQGNTFTISSNMTLYAKWTAIPAPPTPTSLSSVGGNQAAYILFTQSGTVNNYEYSTDDGATFLPFSPAQIYSPVEINTLSTDGLTRLTNGVTYNIKLKAVKNGVSSVESASVSVVPEITSLLATNRIIYLNANESGSYSGSGTTWTNLDSAGSYSASLVGTPVFNTSTPSNKYFDFNTGTATGQYAQINQASAINPVNGTPFTIQLWVRIKNVGSQGTLVSKMFNESRDYDGYNFIYMSDNTLQLHLNGSSRDDKYKSITGVLSNGWVLYTANVKFGGQNRIFINGRQVLNTTSSESNIPSNTQNLTISAGFGGDGECDVGQFYYYTAELTTAQIIQNYDATKSRYL